MSWREAKAITMIKHQINNLFPDRDKKSDGVIGDAKHATKNSDHNPWVIDSRGIGVVTAIDIDKDLTNETKVNVLVNALVANKDRRIKYIIWSNRMISSYPANGYDKWEWRPYRGENPHTEHVHISLKSDQSFYDLASPWDLDIHSSTATQPVPVIPSSGSEDEYVVQKGDSLWKIGTSFGIPISLLQKLNNMKESETMIKIGQTLRLR